MAENTPTYPTAFLMIQNADGTWMASTDIYREVATEHVATRLDVRQGCQEIVSVITQQDQAALVVAMLTENIPTDALRDDPEMRDASTGSTPEN